MGDATGHGFGPALSATQMQAMLRVAFRCGAGLDEAFRHVNNQLAAIEARQGGFAEAILLDSRGRVSEGSGQNVFVVQDGVLSTPPVVDGILA